MYKAKKIELENAGPSLDHQDEATLAAIEEGIRDTGASRTIPMKAMLKLLLRWIAAASSRKKR